MTIEIHNKRELKLRVELVLNEPKSKIQILSYAQLLQAIFF